MATYFDSTDATHLALLPKPMRTAEEIADVSAIVEADVIAEYTDPTTSEDFTLRETLRANTEIADSDYEFVFLVGYEEDSAHADVDAGLRRALRRTIAEVIRWRLTQWKREMGVASESDDRGKSRTYTLDSHSSNFPPGWDRWLIPFDTREPGWGA